MWPLSHYGGVLIQNTTYVNDAARLSEETSVFIRSLEVHHYMHLVVSTSVPTNSVKWIVLFGGILDKAASIGLAK